MNKIATQSVNQTWITDPANKKYTLIKNNFFNALQEQAKQGKIGYYDFLLVAKKLSFRFEQSSHLMALKNYFSKNKNVIGCKKLSDCLSISQASLNSSNEQKIIVKFNVPEINFAPIKQQTQQDDQFQQQRLSASGQSGYQQEQEQAPFQQLGKQQVEQQTQRELMQKMAIILSIKVQQMQKKLHVLTHNIQNHISLLNYFDSFDNEDILYQQFRRGVIEVISGQKEKIKLSEDDVKTIFHLLDQDKVGYITVKQLEKLKNIQQPDGILDKMKLFYKSRLNKQMVKVISYYYREQNTLFKLGKVKSNSIQIYQLKNASLMEFKQMEDAIVNNNTSRANMFNARLSKEAKEKSRIPHFGPLKGASKWKTNQTSTNPSINSQKSHSQPQYIYTYASTHPTNQNTNLFSINKQRQKIQKILKQYKDPNKIVGNRAEKNGETVASKLRSLFIHKVILPREKMLEEEKDKFLKTKKTEHQLSIKPLK